ncbi:unnamed protein product [Clonostachys byssicola]|uniref:Uncharacterized protein n=1 Tax=Clonostachys byssicola TaxID=160290 RepID=A0A9N9YAQ8_9HYPO|nr:unnamed protein product [Clonostachys byssicola]
MAETQDFLVEDWHAEGEPVPGNKTGCEARPTPRRVVGLGQDALGEKYASEPSVHEEVYTPAEVSVPEEPAHEGVADFEVSALVGAVDHEVGFCLVSGILAAEAFALEAASSNEEAPGRGAFALADVSARGEASVLVEGFRGSEVTLVASGPVLVVTLEASEVCHEVHLGGGDEVQVETAVAVFARGEILAVGSLEREVRSG